MSTWEREEGRSVANPCDDINMYVNAVLFGEKVRWSWEAHVLGREIEPKENYATRDAAEGAAVAAVKEKLADLTRYMRNFSAA